MRKLRRFLFYLVSLGILLLAGLIVAGHFWGKRWIPPAVKAINQHLTSPVAVQDIQLTLIRRFPKASLYMQEVLILDSANHDTLLYTPGLYLDFDPWNWWRGERVIDQLAIRSAVANIHRNADGHWNWEIWKKQADTSDSGVEWSLKRIDAEFRTLRVRAKPDNWAYAGRKQAVRITIEDKESGSFRCDLPRNWLVLKKEQWMDDAPLHFRGNWKFDPNNEATLLYIDKLDLPAGKASGVVQWNNDDTRFDITGHFDRPEALKKYLSPVLPDFIRQQPVSGTLQVSGGLAFGTTISGDLEFNWKNGQWSLTNEMQVPIEECRFVLAARNSNFSLNLQKFKPSTREPLLATGSFLLNNGIFGSLRARGTLDARDLPVITEGLNFPGGKAALDLELAIDYRNTGRAMQWNDLRFSGTVDWREWQFRYQEMTGSWTGKTIWSPGVCHTPQMLLTIDNTGAEISGTLQDYHAWPRASLRGAVKMPEVDLELWLATEKDSAEVAQILPSAQIRYEVANLHYGDYHLTGCTGEATLDQDEWTLNGSAVTWEGEHRYRLRHKANKLSGWVRSSAVDVRKLATQFREMLPETVQPGNLSGELSSYAELAIPISNNGSVNPEEIDLFVDYRVRDGLVQELPALKSLRDYLRSNLLADAVINKNKLIERLQYIAFDRLEGSFTLQNGMMRLPETDLKSPSFTARISGEHYLDHRINYRVKFKLSELLRNKRETEYGYIVDDEEGMKLFLHISGTTDDPQFAFDKQAAKKARQEKWASEKQQTRRLFSGEEDSGDEPQAKPRFAIEEEEPPADTSASKPKKPTKVGRFFKKLLESGENPEDQNGNTDFTLEDDDPQ